MPCDLGFTFDPATIQTNAKLAVALAEHLPIFPCYDAGEHAKRPRHGVSWSSARPGQIERVQRWWQDSPQSMPGLHLGAVGLLVFDADGPEGIDAFERLCEPFGGVPECPMVDTPSGGRHYYFRQWPGEKLGNARGALPPKAECPIDIRGDGGYVIAPDATREDGIYAILDGHPLDILQSPELPDFLHDVLTSKREEISPEPLPAQALPAPARRKEITLATPIDMHHPRLRAWVDSAFDREIQALAQCPSGGRNNQLNTSAFAVFQLVGAGWIKEEHAHSALVQAAETCGLVKDDGRRGVLKTIASARRGGLAQPRQVPEEFVRDEEIAASAVELNRALAVSDDGTLHDAETGEVIDAEEAGTDLDEFPDHLTRNIPGLVGELVEWITATAIYPSRMMALGAALTLVGTAMGRTWCGPIEDNGTVLFVLTLAPSGAGKNHSLNAIRTILKLARLPRLIGADEFTGGPAISSMLVDCPVRLCAMDEFGAFIGRLQSRRSSSFEQQATKLLRSLWSTNFSEFLTMAKAQSREETITAAHMSIYGTSTHKEFFDALTGGDVANGFLNRFLFLSSAKRAKAQDPLAKLRDTPLRITDALYAIFGRGVDTAQGELMNSSVSPSPSLVDWQDAAAKAAFDALVAEVDRKSLATDRHGNEIVTELHPYLRRTAEMALRIALIRAVGRNKLKPSISAEDYAWAREIAWWSALAMAKACGLYIADTETQADANRILRIVKSYGGKATRRMILQRLNHRMRGRDLEDTMKSLLESGALRVVGELKPEGGGRTVIWYGMSRNQS